MEIVATPQALRRQLAEQPTGPGGLAFVPTMGNLHDGHLSLVRKALDSADTVVVSIFVNPMQFADGEDLDAYPRTLDRDIELLTEASADLLFTPNVDALYPQGLKTHTAVRVPGLTEVLCGRHRPGHFDGVTTVVCKLLNLVQPDIALFGEKDLQQLLVIEKMVADLAIPVRVEGVATARAADGLALSSRNGYLSPDERDLAPRLYASLLQIRDAITSGARDFQGLCADAVQGLESEGFAVDYCELRRCDDLSLAQPGDQDIAIFAAASLGSTRLIDNIRLQAY